MARIRIVHIINSFEYGGAEAMLCNLLLRTDTDRFEPHVVALIDDLTVAGPILEAGIPLAIIGMKPGMPDPRGLLRLALYLRRLRPHVVQTWMDHSNLIGGLAARTCPGARVIWGVHHSNHVKGLTKRSTLLTVAACAKLSRRLPHRIVCCSQHASALYAAQGFDAGRICVIPNGFDTDAFKPSPELRRRIRQSLNLPSDAPVVGLVARYDPLKDHPNFLRAGAILLRRHPQVRFLLCGAGVDEDNEQLMGLIHSLGLTEACRLLGPRRDVADIYASLDLATSSSISEAFPLAVGEAMACGVPCVATDVGDSGLIVGDAGRIVPPRDPEALATACFEILTMQPASRQRLGAAARERIVQLFDLSAVTRRYEQLYLEEHAQSVARSAAQAEDSPEVVAST